MKKIIFAIVILIIVGGIYFYYRSRETTIPPEMPVNIENVSAPTDFSKVGYLTVNNPGLKQDTMYLIYEEPGKPALKKELTLDGLSVCGGDGRTSPCLAMSATYGGVFGGKRVLVEGNEEGDKVLLRKLYVLGDSKDGNAAPQAGQSYIGWWEASNLVSSCAVDKIFQDHSLNVDLSLRDGRKFRSVEPVIDEVMKIADMAESVCGKIKIATE